MVDTVPAFIPEIAGLLEGLNWDISEKESTRYLNESSDHPIEDPSRSFMSDHNRERPTVLSVTISVSAHPAKGNPANDGPQRISNLVSALLDIRAKQAVSPAAYFNVVTGLRIHENMQIKSMRTERDRKNPSVLMIDLSLEEKRFATSPRLSSTQGLLDAADGQRSVRNVLLVSDRDRMIAEGTFVRKRARRGPLGLEYFGDIPPPVTDFGV